MTRQPYNFNVGGQRTSPEGRTKPHASISLANPVGGSVADIHCRLGPKLHDAFAVFLDGHQSSFRFSFS